MLRKPAPLPVWLGLGLRKLAVGTKQVGVPFAPLAGAPSGWVRWHIDEVDDFPGRGPGLQPGFNVGSDKYARWPCERNGPPDVIQKHLGKPAVAQRAETFRKARRPGRRLIRVVGAGKAGRLVGESDRGCWSAGHVRASHCPMSAARNQRRRLHFELLRAPLRPMAAVREPRRPRHPEIHAVMGSLLRLPLMVPFSAFFEMGRASTRAICGHQTIKQPSRIIVASQRSCELRSDGSTRQVSDRRAVNQSRLNR
jgi:hypothetical protein